MAKPNWEDTRLKLIDTYKWMNNELRPKGEDVLAAEHGGESIKSVVRQMKDSELLFAKALTQSLTGEILGDEGSDEPPVIGNEAARETGAILISQFGSARATTLNTMQAADDEAWDRPLQGSKKMLDLANELVESDRVHLEKLRRMVGA
ncbi:MAG TPA: hypothetical protein VD789_14110 [Thermomicrobiales bacterium]|nr:hypothetical protein [Thermomicrobiales bacterium]